MFKSINVLVIILFLHSIQSKAQETNKKFFYNKTRFTTLVTAEAVKNKVIEGNSIGIKTSFYLTPSRLGLFVGGEAFALKSGSSFTGDPLVESDNKTIVAGFGVTTGILKIGRNVMNDTRINFGLTHISQAGSLVLPDLFGYLKFNQIQNDWIHYIEGVTETNIRQNGFNRFIFGARYEIPISSLAQASVNGEEIKIPPSNRRNFKAWVELGLFSFVVNNSWSITPSFRSEYIHVTQNQLNLIQPGVGISIFNLYSEVIRINYSQEFNPIKNTQSLHRIRLTIDFINLGRGFPKL